MSVCGCVFAGFAQAFEREVKNKLRKISQSVAVQLLANQYVTAALTGEPVRRPKGWMHDSGTDSVVHRRAINAVESDNFLSTVSKTTPLQLSGPSGHVRMWYFHERGLSFEIRPLTQHANSF